MSWFQDTLVNFIDSVFSIVNGIVNWFTSGFEIFQFLPNMISNITAGFGYIPSFLLPFAGLCLAISVIYLVIGRDHT